MRASLKDSDSYRHDSALCSLSLHLWANLPLRLLFFDSVVEGVTQEQPLERLVTLTGNTADGAHLVPTHFVAITTWGTVEGP